MDSPNQQHRPGLLLLQCPRLLHGVSQPCSYTGPPNSRNSWAMVGVINPNATTSLDVQKSLAMNSSYQLNPGEGFPSEATSSASAGYTAASTVTTARSIAASTSAATSSTTAPTASSHSTLSTGAIAGVAIGGTAVLLTAGFLIWYCGRQSRQNNTQPAQEAPPNYVPPAYSSYAQPSMSPSAKHISGVTVSSAQPSPNFGYTDQQPHMAPFGAVQATSPNQGLQHFYYQQQQTYPHMSPRSAAFGTPQMGENSIAAPAAVEADSERGTSPSPPPNNPRGSGIEAFLARQGRMSPSARGASESGITDGNGP